MQWSTGKVNVYLEDFDCDLKQFGVFNKKGERLGTVNPGSIADMETSIKELNSGECPVADSWDNGNGENCGGWL